MTLVHAVCADCDTSATRLARAQCAHWPDLQGAVSLRNTVGSARTVRHHAREEMQP
ncbi:MAG TPA: hypothetical protein VER37_10885 [Thermomicrobiales bacterium]|nr:hypothetical protein [Thermomicrobiales bacterium]